MNDASLIAPAPGGAPPSPAVVPALPAWDTHVHVFDAQAPVQPGHYQPMHRPLAEVEALAAAQGVQRLVLVQPSVYGHDNRVLLDALAQAPDRHRGVVAVDAPPDLATLDHWHGLGVRGIRFNRVSPVGPQGDPRPLLRALAPALAERGWHVLWYLRAEELGQALHWHDACGLPFVLDHLAGLHADLPQQDPAWLDWAELAGRGAWLKLSGWYRLQDEAPYSRLLLPIQRAAALCGTRLLWGSDWPHTSFPADSLPPYASTWAPVAQALGEVPAQAVRTVHSQVLYGP